LSVQVTRGVGNSLPHWTRTTLPRHRPVECARLIFFQLALINYFKFCATFPNFPTTEAMFESYWALLGDLEVSEEGRIVIEIREAITKRVWADAPTPAGLNTITDVRAMRNEDNEISQKNYTRRSRVTSEKAANEA
jgi:hypothetical protein